MATRISAMLCRAIFVACLIRACTIAEEATPRIIIIGSGAAGIAAASRLLQNGFDNITILEAENRIGGRILTTKFGDYWVDIGGQWIHGEENNVAFELAWPLGLVEKSNTSWSSELFDSSGSSMPKEVANDFMGFYFNLTDNHAPDEYMDKSIGEYLKFKIHEYFMEHPDIEEEKREPLENMLNLFQMAHDAGDNWHNVSAKGLREYFRCAGDLGINWKDRGYATILDILMKRIPNPDEELAVFENTVFNAEVSQINYNLPHSVVRIVTSNGNEYFAEHVIVTISLGVLKADHRTLFNPPLPQLKINAIESLAFGTVGKIYLFFPEPWWDTENGTDMFAFHWSKRDRNEIENDPEKSWMLGVFNVMRVEHKPQLLCCWLAGPSARKMEIVPEERIFNQTKELLHRFLGKAYNITEPTAMLRSKWFSNKHFRGTYSYRSLATERSGAMAIHLADPITQENPVVLFAGEATSPHYYSTVHGAIGSGWREADRLINYYANRKSASPESKDLRNSSR